MIVYNVLNIYFKSEVDFVYDYVIYECFKYDYLILVFIWVFGFGLGFGFGFNFNVFVINIV